MVETPNCPLCSSDKFKFNFKQKGYQLLSCLNCDLHFINPYQQNESNRNPLSSELQYISEKLAVSYYLPYIIDYIENKNSLLDIGCGCGVLLNSAKNLGIRKVVGLENDKKRADFARQTTDCLIIETEINNFETIEKFEIITLINVISHLSDLDIFFKKINTLLEDKGKLIIKTGLMKCGFGQNNWYDWQIPEHIHFLGENTPEYIAQKFNFKLIEKILIPLSEDLISKEYLQSPGRYKFVNVLKSALVKFPIGINLLKQVYNWHTKNKLYTSIVVFEKA